MCYSNILCYFVFIGFHYFYTLSLLLSFYFLCLSVCLKISIFNILKGDFSLFVVSLFGAVIRTFVFVLKQMRVRKLVCFNKPCPRDKGGGEDSKFLRAHAHRVNSRKRKNVRSTTPQCYSIHFRHIYWVPQK